MTAYTFLNLKWRSALCTNFTLSLHSGWASWDKCRQVSPDQYELVSLMGYHSTPEQHSHPTMHSMTLMVYGWVFGCNLPSVLVGPLCIVWLWWFMAGCLAGCLAGCSAVICHPYFLHNDRGVLCAVVITQVWNRSYWYHVFKISWLSHPCITNIVINLLPRSCIHHYMYVFKISWLIHPGITNIVIKLYTWCV